LNSSRPASIEAAIGHCADKKPLVYGANAENLDAMVKIAKEKKVALGIYAKGLDALSDLSEKAKGMGITDIVLDSGARTAKEMVEEYTMIRRAALKKSFKPLGFPVISFVGRDDSTLEAAVASIGIMKYASIIVVNSIEKWKTLALLTLRQNIYTDQQVPMQVEQKIYKIGDANENSPLLITTNFQSSRHGPQVSLWQAPYPTLLRIARPLSLLQRRSLSSQGMSQSFPAPLKINLVMGGRSWLARERRTSSRRS
ncbi:MAG: CdhD protein, partial [Deltaproteobacteria bacterium]|nr:CdhD protein [Deltaproteobacteria bacterium]